MLIVARWPGGRERDLATEHQVDAVIDLVRAIRNARAEAKIEPARWLETGVAVPHELGLTFEALRPAIERLARARPLERHLSREALHGIMGSVPTLAVISGDIEALVTLESGGGDESVDADRARLERELAEAEGFLASAQARLANEAFTSKAPPAVVAGARAREAELADQVQRLQDRLGR
jgi:valyl-tRNA synthetase